MINLLVYITCLINNFSGGLVNDKFLNVKLNALIITGFIYNTRYEKQVVLINHSSISPILQNRWELGFYLFSKKKKKKKGNVHFLQKWERLVK